MNVFRTFACSFTSIIAPYLRGNVTHPNTPEAFKGRCGDNELLFFGQTRRETIL